MTPLMARPNTTLSDATNTGGDHNVAVVPRPALVLLWSERQPWRPGEIILYTNGEEVGFGRYSDAHKMLHPREQRPGEVWLPDGAPLDDDNLSRLQLLIRPSAVDLEIIPRSEKSTRVNNQKITGPTRLKSRDLLFLKGIGLFMFLLRPAVLPVPMGNTVIPSARRTQRVRSCRRFRTLPEAMRRPRPRGLHR